jgi:hypothetical protein
MELTLLTLPMLATLSLRTLLALLTLPMLVMLSLRTFSAHARSKLPRSPPRNLGSGCLSPGELGTTTVDSIEEVGIRGGGSLFRRYIVNTSSSCGGAGGGDSGEGDFNKGIWPGNPP